MSVEDNVDMFFLCFSKASSMIGHDKSQSTETLHNAKREEEWVNIYLSFMIYGGINLYFIIRLYFSLQWKI